MKKLMLALMIMSCGGYEDVAEETDAVYGEVTKVSIRAANGQYFAAEGGGGSEYGRLLADGKVADTWEIFTLISWPNGFALQAHTGQYVVAEGGGGGIVNCNRDWIGAWETLSLNKL